MYCQSILSVLDDLIKLFEISSISDVKVLRALDDLLIILGRCVS